MSISSSSPPIPVLYFALLFAVTMCSSAGVVFAKMPDVDPFLKAGWRLWCQDVIQLPFFLNQYNSVLKGHDSNGYTSTHFKFALLTLTISGFCLGCHFSAWVWSISHTTLAHSLMCVSMHPIVLNAYGWSRHYIKGSKPPTRMETIGTLVGIVGAALMLLDVAHSGEDTDTSDPDAVTSPTFKGNFVAFLGAVAMAVYLLCGESLRTKSENTPPIPLWLYAFPVTLLASVTCVVLALINGADVYAIRSDNLDQSAFGFLSAQYALQCLYLGGASGVGGHTMLNTLLAYLSPTIVGTSLLAEPVIGGVIGYVVGVQGIPGVWTWLGGTVLMVGLVMTVKGGETNEEDEVKEGEGKGWIERGYGGTDEDNKL